MSEAAALLAKMAGEGELFEAIKTAIEPLMGPGCTLERGTESCITSSGVSGYRDCGRITGCNDPSDNTPWSCGGCQDH